MKKVAVRHDLVPLVLQLWLNESPLVPQVVEKMRQWCEEGFDVNMTLSRYHIRKNKLFCAPCGGSLVSLSCGLLAHQLDDEKAEPLSTQQWQNVMQWQKVLVEQFGASMSRKDVKDELSSPLERSLIWGSVAGVKRVLELHAQSATRLDWSTQAQKGYAYWFLNNLGRYKLSETGSLVQALDSWFTLCDGQQKKSLLTWLEAGLVGNKNIGAEAELGVWFAAARQKVPDWSWGQAQSALNGSCLFALYESERQKEQLEGILNVPTAVKVSAEVLRL